MDAGAEDRVSPAQHWCARADWARTWNLSPFLSHAGPGVARSPLNVPVRPESRSAARPVSTALFCALLCSRPLQLR